MFSLFAIACESEERPAPGSTAQFTENLQAGTYTRTKDGKSYAIEFGGNGRYSMSVDGVARHVGTYTLGAPSDMAVDDRDSQDVCPNELNFGTYDWELNEDDSELSFKVIEDACDVRVDDFKGGGWIYQPGSFPTPTP